MSAQSFWILTVVVIKQAWVNIHTLQTLLVDRDNSNILLIVSNNIYLLIGFQIVSQPKFGVGSRSWAGREKRTEAMSVTPMNLESQECLFSFDNGKISRKENYWPDSDGVPS